jgi:hypothetical protein
VLLCEIPKLLFPEFQNYSMRCGREERDTYLCKSQSDEDDLKANGNSRAFQEFFVATSCNNPANKQTEESC